MDNSSSARYYQKIQRKTKRKLAEGIKIFPKKKKHLYKVPNNIKISLNKEIKVWLSIENIL